MTPEEKRKAALKKLLKEQYRHRSGPKQSEIDATEKALQSASDDVRMRLKQLDLYRSGRKTKRNVERHFSHFIWLIDNCPTDPIWRSAYPLPEYTDQQKTEIQRHLRKQMKLHPKNAEIIGRAAEVMPNLSRQQQIRLLRRAQDLEPNEWRWTRRLAGLFRYEALNGATKNRKKFAEMALVEADRSLDLEPHSGEVMGIYVDFLPVAIEFGYLDKADDYAKRFLATVKGTHLIWYEQTAYFAQARIALARNQRTKAKSLLQKGLASLDSDPEKDSHIAKSNRIMYALDEFLSLGERETVIRALRICSKSCIGPRQKLIKRWLQQVTDGKNPTLRFEERWR